MRDWVRGILTLCGQSVTVETAAGQVSARAFLQPVTQRSEQVPDSFTGIGYVDGRLWLYLGQAAVEAGDRIHWNGRSFQVRSGRPYYIGEQPLYWWASLVEAREAAE